jgi:hypothetical protein
MANAPEVNLWKAVIWKAITDLEELLETAAQQNQRTGKVLHRVRMDISTIERCIHNDWFKHICEFSGVHHDWVHKLVERMKTNAGWQTFRFQGGVCTRPR